MKKNLLNVIALLPFIAYGAENHITQKNISPFAGLYLGAGGGVNMQFFKSDYYDTSEGTHHWINFGNDGGSGHLYTGFNHELRSNLMIGLDGHTQYNWTAPSQHTHNNISSFDSMKLRWQVGISPKLGYVYKNNLYYIIAGPEWVQFRHSDVADDGTHGNDNKYLFGGLFGFGLSQNILQNLNLVEQFSYGTFHSTSYTLTNSNKSTINDPSEATVMFALEYHFG